MPVGKPSGQTIRSKKYQEKVGLISKAGVSQAGQISEMMKEFIEQNK